MNSQANISQTDAVPVGKRDFVLPSHYAINAAMAEMHSSQKVRGTNDHWLWGFAPAVATGRLDFAAFSHDIENGAAACATMTCKRQETRKAGKPALDYTITKLVPDRFRAHRELTGWGEELEVVVVRKDEIHARKNYLEERSAVSGLAVCRHALERFYQREHLSHEEIRSRILSDMASVDRQLAFAVASGLFCHGHAYTPNAVTVLPLGDGLLVVRNAVIVADEGWRPSVRIVRKKRSLLTTPTDIDPCRSMEPFTRDGKRSEGFLMAMGVTYLSSDILRLEQRAYASLFHAEAEKHDLEDLGKNMGRTWLAHEAKAQIPSIEIDPRLRFLLSQIVNSGKAWPFWYAMGWTRHSDPLDSEE